MENISGLIDSMQTLAAATHPAHILLVVIPTVLAISAAFYKSH